MIKSKKFTLILFLIFTIVILMPIVSANNDTVYVSPDGDDSGDGSFENPYFNITKAINQDSNRIILKNGTYNQQNINLNKSVEIMGLGDVIIDGENNNWILNIISGSVMITNLTFINAYSSGFGAAIINNGTLTVKNSYFINNSARSAAAVDNSGTLKVINSIFINNEAYGRDGGAISNMGDMEIYSSIFINNSAARNAGAIKHQGNKFKLVNSTFILNSAIGSDNYGGAVYIWASKAEIFNSTFLNNYGGYGGALFISGGNIETTALNLTQCVFENNKASSGSDIEIEDGIININYSKILDGVTVFKTTEVNLDYNWWGENTPDFSTLYSVSNPEIYAVLNLQNNGEMYRASLNWQNTSDLIERIPGLNGSVYIGGELLEEFNLTDYFYEFISNSSDVSVKVDREIQKSLSKTKLVADNVEMYYHDNTRLKVYLFDESDNPLINQSILISINGMDYNRTTDSDGLASIALNLNSGKYNADIWYNSVLKKYSSSNTSAVVNILPTVNGNDVVKVFRNDTQYYATFKNTNGLHLSNGEIVTFNINGVYYNRTVTENGAARLNINLGPGKYIITAFNLKTGERTSNNITVISRLIENRDITKYFKNETQYTVKVIGDDGKAVGAGVNVTFNINGVFYTRQTNESGIAKMNINLAPGDYIITAEYSDCKASNIITVFPVLHAADLTKTYGDTNQFVATLVDGTGSPFPNQSVEFNINGVFYYKTTDSNGDAKLNINLMPGEYIITSSYNGTNIANTVKVNSQEK